MSDIKSKFGIFSVVIFLVVTFLYIAWWQMGKKGMLSADSTIIPVLGFNSVMNIVGCFLGIVGLIKKYKSKYALFGLAANGMELSSIAISIWFLYSLATNTTLP